MPSATQTTGKSTANGNSKGAEKVRFPDREVSGQYVHDIGHMTAGQLTAFHIDRVISFEYDAKTTGVFHKVRGVLREVHHDGGGSDIWLTGLECDSGDKDDFPLGWMHPVYVEGGS